MKDSNLKSATVPCTAAILAGGTNSRMHGENKAFLEIHGKPILEHLLDRLSPFFQETILISNAPLMYLDYDYPVYSDLANIRSSLTGVYTALSCARHPHVLMVPCDLPFLQPAVLDLLIREMDPKFDIIIPRTQAGFEPLCAIYSKRCLKPAGRMLNSNNLSVRSFFSQVRVKEVSEDKLRAVDPDLLSFMNVNTPQDLENARAKEV